MKIKSLIGILFLFLPSIQLAQADNLEIKKALKFVIYDGAPLPPKVSEQEKKNTVKALKRSKAQKSLLNKLYNDDINLIALAYRDTDGDGDRDFRVDEETGKFYIGDLDIDGDGVQNIFDSAPYTPETAYEDLNRNGISDHIDWSSPNSVQKSKTYRQAEIQSEIFTKYGIILIEKAESFDLRTLEMIQDLLNSFFRSPLSNRKLKSLKSIATDDYPVIGSENNDGTLALALAHSENIILYKDFLDLPTFSRIGVLVHEIAHHFQFSLDWSKEDQNLIRRHSYFRTKGFRNYLKKFGFSFNARISDWLIPEEQLDFIWNATQDYEFKFKSKKMYSWNKTVQSIYDKTGTHWYNSPIIRTHSIVSPYSFQSPWEWHSDNLQAFFLSLVESKAMNLCKTSKEKHKLMNTLRKYIEKTWPGFRYSNLKSPEILKSFRKEFPISDSNLEKLTFKYLKSTIASSCNELISL